MTEHVLAFPADLIEFEDFTGGIISEPRDVERIFQRIIGSGELEYIERRSAEKDPAWKQLIPYTVIVRGNDVFTYERTPKGGEARLHNKWSLGVGGHINPCDGEASEAAASYWNAFWRELREEVVLTSEDSPVFTPTAPIVALLYDDRDEVGRVHFGVVHILDVGWSDVATRFVEPALANGRFVYRGELHDIRDNFESWSQFVIDCIL